MSAWNALLAEQREAVGVVHAEEARLAGDLARRTRRSAPRRRGRGRCRRACRSEPSRSATRRAWPPAPKVQSTAVSPARRGASGRSARRPGRGRACGSCQEGWPRRSATSSISASSASAAPASARRPQTSMWSPTPTTTTSFSIARVLEQRRRRVTRPRRVELDVERVAQEEARRACGTRGSSGSGRRARARSSPRGSRASRSRRRARGPWREPLRPRRPCGTWPAAQPVLRVQRVVELPSKSQWSLPCPGKSRTGVAEWEEPRHSGRLMVRHRTPLSPTLQHIPHFSVRGRGSATRPSHESALKRDSAGGVVGRGPAGRFAADAVHLARSCCTGDCALVGCGNGTRRPAGRCCTGHEPIAALPHLQWSWPAGRSSSH